MEQKRIPLTPGDTLNLNMLNGSGESVWTIDQVIGYGGSCIVYRAKQPSTELGSSLTRIGIIKEYYPASITSISRDGSKLVIPDDVQDEFLRKKQSFMEGFCSREKYYHIDSNHAMARPFLYGEDNATIYAVSDPNEGQTLSDLTQDELNLNRAANIMISVCEAISTLHDNNLLYLDCKPDNIFHYNVDRKDHIRLFDFDTVISEDELRGSKYSSTRVIPSYSEGWAPPEQKNGRIKEIGKRSDLYSVGTVFFWLLMGRKPDGDTSVSTYGEFDDFSRIADNTFDWTKAVLCNGLTSKNILGLIQQIMEHTLAKSVSKRFNDISKLEKCFQQLADLTESNSVVDDSVREAETNITAALQESSQAQTTLLENVKSDILEAISELSNTQAETPKVTPAIASKEEPFVQDGELKFHSGHDVRVVYSDGSTYVGDWKLGSRHGYGRYDTADGKQTYIGDWAYDMRCGQGRLLDEDAGEYNGTWKNDLMEGYGEFKHLDTTIYKGNWSQGKRSGDGIRIGKKKGVLRCTWKDDKLCGHGVLTTVDGKIKFDGEFFDDEIHGFGIFYYDSGDIYKGEWQAGKRSKGKMTYANGNVYDGEWKDGKHFGHGVMTYATGLIKSYNGEWKDGIKSGHGVLVYENGSSYDGEWANGNYNGFGVERHADDSVYEGYWLDGKKNGHGKNTYANGHVYDGEWKDGKRFGLGIYTWPDGERYEGMWDDLRNGHGVDHYANGDVYDGEWKNDKREGHGVMTDADGRVYDGEWKDGKQFGHGIMTWPDGERYEGMWDNGRNGHGLTRYASGSVYDGEWKDDKRSGHGIITYPNGERYEGSWENSLRNGKGVCHYANGHVYDGEWKDGKRNGQCEYRTDRYIYKGSWNTDDDDMTYGTGVFEFKGGWVYEGQWANLAYHGHGKMIYPNKDVYDGEWANNKRQGQGKMVYHTGLIYEGQWENGERNGRGQETEGHYVRTGNFVNGKKHGVFTEYERSYPAGVYTVLYEDNIRKSK